MSMVGVSMVGVSMWVCLWMGVSMCKRDGVHVSKYSSLVD